MKENKENNGNVKWFIEVFIITFILSLFFSYISTTAINDIPMLPAIIILLAVIAVGIIFDIVGVAVTVAGEEEFHAKASKKIPGAKTAVRLIRNSSIVANICADVIGDICGVLSGAISAIVAMKIAQLYELSFPIQFLISALVASLTVGGKALGKGFAKKESGSIVWIVSKIIKPFYREKKEK
ncbi:MAG: hypothetical protein J6A04_02945 [Clostridia bacterium]|nr:hypothetical protein [Clostridia bacterium]